jgi:hypothetical protein
MRILPIPLVLLALAVSLNAQTLPSADEVVAKVKANAFQSYTSLPDFVCTERITSTSAEKGRFIEHRAIESLFSSTRVNSGSGYFSIQESREIRAIDGKLAEKNAKMPKVPYLVTGMAVSGAIMVFGTDAARSYKALGLEKTGDISALRIAFDTKPGQTAITGKIGRASSGAVLVDMESMQPVHIEFRSKDPDGFFSEDFKLVTLDQKAYWLPRTVQAEMKNKDTTLTFVAEYIDCRKFEVSVQIKPIL